MNYFLGYQSDRSLWRKLALAICLYLLQAAAVAQEVKISTAKDTVVLSVWAVKPYSVMAGSAAKTPVLSVECSVKGKKSVHLVKFTAGTPLVEGDPETTPRSGQFNLKVVVGGKPTVASWIPFGDPITFAYYGKTEAERSSFVQTLLSAPTASFEFTPFITGSVVTSVFDLSQLQQEVGKHPECAIR